MHKEIEFRLPFKVTKHKVEHHSCSFVVFQRHLALSLAPAMVRSCRHPFDGYNNLNFWIPVAILCSSMADTMTLPFRKRVKSILVGFCEIRWKCVGRPADGYCYLSIIIFAILVTIYFPLIVFDNLSLNLRCNIIEFCGKRRDYWKKCHFVG